MKGIYILLYLRFSLSTADFKRKIYRESWEYCKTGWQGGFHGKVKNIIPVPVKFGCNLTVTCSLSGLGSSNSKDFKKGMPPGHTIELITLWRLNKGRRWEYISSYWPRWDVDTYSDNGTYILNETMRESFSEEYNARLFAGRVGFLTYWLPIRDYNFTFSGGWPKKWNADKMKMRFQIFEMSCDWVVPYKCVFYYNTSTGHDCYTFESHPVIKSKSPKSVITHPFVVSRTAAEYPIGAKINFTCDFHGPESTTLTWQEARCEKPNSFSTSLLIPRVTEIKDKPACAKFIRSELNYTISKVFCRFRCVTNSGAVLGTQDLTLSKRPLMRMMVSPDNEEYLDGDIVLFTCTLTDPTSSSTSPTWFQEDLIELRTARCDSPGDFERDVAHLYTYQSGCDVGVIYEKNVTISQHCQVKCVDSHNRVSVIKQFKIPNRKIYSTTRKPIINVTVECTEWSGWSECSPNSTQRRLQWCNGSDDVVRKSGFEDRNCTPGKNTTDPEEPEETPKVDKEDNKIVIIVLLSTLIPTAVAGIVCVVCCKSKCCARGRAELKIVEYTKHVSKESSFEESEKSPEKKQSWMIIDDDSHDRSTDYSLLEFYSENKSATPSQDRAYQAVKDYFRFTKAEPLHRHSRAFSSGLQTNEISSGLQTDEISSASTSV